MRTSVWVAVLCPITERVLIAKRGRSVRNGGLWNFFGGGLDEGECAEGAAVRELWEEGGIHSPQGGLSPLGEFTLDEKRNLLFGLSLDWEVAPRLNAEHDSWRWIAFSDLRQHRRLHPPTQRLAPYAESFALAAVSHRRSLLSQAWGGQPLSPCKVPLTAVRTGLRRDTGT